MMNKEEVIKILENFRNYDGISFDDAHPEAMRIIANALDVLYARIFPNLFQISPLLDPKYEKDNQDAFFSNIEQATRAGYSMRDLNKQIYGEFVGIDEKED